MLQTPHPLIVIAIFAALPMRVQRRWQLSLGVALAFSSSSIRLLGGNHRKPDPRAVGLRGLHGRGHAHRDRRRASSPALRRHAPVLDLMQTLPPFVYLIPAIVFFGIGMVPGLIATVIFVVPAPIRLTHLGISSTPTALLEAAQAFGATPRQALWKVELPYALPQIMAGLNQTIMLSLSMVVIAALVGADGLGVPVVRALNSVNTSLGFESGLSSWSSPSCLTGCYGWE